MKLIKFSSTSLEQFEFWIIHDPKIAQRIVKIIKEITKTPFIGIGKPEKLKSDLKGCWSRRITDEHRLVYQVYDEEIIIVSCRFHYN